jgi:hypothetical protein
MAYHDVFLLTQDFDFLARVTACYAVETLGQDNAENPNAWATVHIWDMAAQPDFGDAYAYALNTGNTEPGKDPAVITDAQILSAVQAIM